MANYNPDVYAIRHHIQQSMESISEDLRILRSKFAQTTSPIVDSTDSEGNVVIGGGTVAPLQWWCDTSASLTLKLRNIDNNMWFNHINMSMNMVDTNNIPEVFLSDYQRKPTIIEDQYVYPFAIGARFLKVSSSKVKPVTATPGKIESEDIFSNTGTITTLNSTTGNITTINSTTGNITNIYGSTANINTITSISVTATSSVSTYNLTVTNFASIKDLTVTGTLTANIFEVDNMTVNVHLEVNGSADFNGSTDFNNIAVYGSSAFRGTSIFYNAVNMRSTTSPYPSIFSIDQSQEQIVPLKCSLGTGYDARITALENSPSTLPSMEVSLRHQDPNKHRAFKSVPTDPWTFNVYSRVVTGGSSTDSKSQRIELGFAKIRLGIGTYDFRGAALFYTYSAATRVSYRFDIANFWDDATETIHLSDEAAAIYSTPGQGLYQDSRGVDGGYYVYAPTLSCEFTTTAESYWWIRIRAVYQSGEWAFLEGFNFYFV